MKVKKENLVFAHDIESEDGNKFYGVGYSGKVIENHPYWENLAFDVGSMKSKKQVPILFNHDMNRIVGHARLSFTDKVEVNGMFSKITDEGKMISSLIKDEGFEMQESVYIEPERIERVREGQSMTVNGHVLEGPGHVFYGGTIREVSMTPLGADSNTSTIAFSSDEVLEIEINEKGDYKMSKKTKQTEQKLKFKKLYEEEGPEAAFKFACSCQREVEAATEAKQDTTELDDLKAENERLSEQVAELLAKDEAAKKQSRVDRLEALGLEVTEHHLSFTDEAFEAVIAPHEAKEEAKKKFKKELTKKDGEGAGSSSKKDEKSEEFMFALNAKTAEIYKSRKGTKQEVSFMEANREAYRALKAK